MHYTLGVDLFKSLTLTRTVKSVSKTLYYPVLFKKKSIEKSYFAI